MKQVPDKMKKKTYRPFSPVMVSHALPPKSTPNSAVHHISTCIPLARRSLDVFCQTHPATEPAALRSLLVRWWAERMLGMEPPPSPSKLSVAHFTRNSDGVSGITQRSKPPWPLTERAHEMWMVQPIVAT